MTLVIFKLTGLLGSEPWIFRFFRLFSHHSNAEPRRLPVALHLVLLASIVPKEMKVVGSNSAKGSCALLCSKQLRKSKAHIEPIINWSAKPWANPTTVSYNASVVKIYNATSSMVRFYNKDYYFWR
jgi:hypothetical protein